MPDENKHRRTTMGSLGYTEEFTVPWVHRPAGAGGDDDGEQPPVAKRHWGKYRGVVVNNQDEPPRGRLLVEVAGIVVTNWALPCLPVASIESGTFMRPQIGSNVWVEFERGDPDKPIWTGCFWGEADLPPIAYSEDLIPAETIMSMVTALNGIVVSDVPVPVSGPAPPGNVVITSGDGAVTISMTPGGITISAPTVNIIADTKFTVAAPNFIVA
ncbi:MAG: hypothetical protein JO286_02275 [Solirubrobacterales bacterium]|nr:hypothetical protein [Solirubrobacterales bacterium]MBV9365348.1 hypothetical protein [Solirubrobacterales bacterium]MBV9805976.1 hypothetical protein [Solirubrobacterales bacterium]